jgi:hypothetical protein
LNSLNPIPYITDGHIGQSINLINMYNFATHRQDDSKKNKIIAVIRTANAVTYELLSGM